METLKTTLIYNTEGNSMDSSKKTEQVDQLPLVTIITPAYNEAAIIQKNLARLCQYMASLEREYRWEIIVVNDGSKDETGALGDAFAKDNPNVIIYHHKTNKNLGGAMQTGFKLAQGDYIIVMDLDLSYNETHIERLLATIREKEADIVIASPYMPGGKNTAVPPFRLLMSKVVNKIMRWMAPVKIYTFTSMVRVYRRGFLKKLNLKSNTYSINPEIIHKGLILRAKIEEIPAHLDWSFQKEVGKARTSSIRVFRGITAGMMSGFIFRPYMFFMTIGSSLLIIALYIILWIFIHSIHEMSHLPADLVGFELRFSKAVATVFIERPHSFMVGGIALVVALQFIGIGFLSLQSKRYFDELFHLNTGIFEKK